VGMSVGRFVTATAVARAPDPVRVTVGVAVGRERADPPARYAQRIVAALEAHSRRYGPYPWSAYSVAITPVLTGGIEYPMHVMQGPGSVGRSTSHEVAHQWFYALVGNDQGRDPWLDEGLASWAEARFEGTVAGFVARDIPAVARGRAGAPMTYWDQNYSAYYRGVYVQPVQALARLGAPEAVDAALRTYVAAQSYRVARPADLVSVLLAAFPAGRPVLAQYGLLPAG
jgi:hypothetical protein